MTQTTTTATFLAFALTTLSGCVFDMDGWGYDDADYGYGYGESELNADDGALRGDLGNIADFDGNARISDAYGYDDYAYIEMHAEGRNWWTMNGVTIEGGIDHPELVDGATLTFHQDDRYYGGSGSLYVSVLGCSGPETGNWDYDRTAEEVTVTVRELEDRKVIDYVATFPEDGGEVSGSVTVW